MSSHDSVDGGEKDCETKSLSVVAISVTCDDSLLVFAFVTKRCCCCCCDDVMVDVACREACKFEIGSVKSECRELIHSPAKTLAMEGEGIVLLLLLLLDG